MLPSALLESAFGVPTNYLVLDHGPKHLMDHGCVLHVFSHVLDTLTEMAMETLDRPIH